VLINDLNNHKVIFVECGDAHSGCITEEGFVFVWGIGLNGRLGNTLMINVSLPSQIFEEDPQIQKLFFGMTSSFAVRKNGTSLSWGSNQFGKLGHDDASRQYLLARIIFKLSK
jgi:E3 ubiquitin-protein ligase HERC2